MPTTYLSIAVLVIALLLIPKPGLAEKVYKWVDEQGKTHYSQHNPANPRATVVDVSHHPKDSQNAADPSVENTKRMAKELEERDRKERAAAEKQTFERDKKMALDKENKRRQKEIDDKAIEDCRRKRNAYCDDIDRVRSESKKKKR